MAIADIACNKMKKLFYCLLVAFGLSLLATSCEKDPSGDESNIIGAVQTYNGTTESFYFDRNIKGDVIALYNSSGTKVASYIYDAWGNCTTKTLVSNNFSTYNPIRYRGYYYDRETGLYYLNARYYNPEWRRFISPDSTEYIDPDTPNGLNLYAYCGNDPINRFDPSGYDWEWNSFMKGLGYLATGIGAIVAGALVIASGVATWPILLIAGVTIGAGALTTINGASEIVEAGTGYNFVEDTVFGGNSVAYNTYATITGTVATVGSIICGRWYKCNAPRIQAYKNISSYDYGKSAAKHMGERSYYDSTLLKKQIIKYGKMVNEGNGVFTFRIGGTSFNAVTQLYHSGTWELTVINSMKLIGHFLLKY